MDYKKKLEHANRVAEQIENQINVNEIEAALKNEGLYERDINSIMVSAKNVITDKYKAVIREHLLADKDIYTSAMFQSFDAVLLTNIIEREKQQLAIEEKRKIERLVKENYSEESILDQIDNRFLVKEKAIEFIKKHHKAKDHNSGDTRLFNIVGGFGLLLITGIILVSSGRFLYVLFIIGIVLIVKGFTTEVVKIDD
mgnify:CR=1 FL=1|jgi:activator of 2-hydroxyglutaryl-CoA dehydratase